ncbi:MAG: nucleoside hydrolase [bacterium]
MSNDRIPVILDTDIGSDIDDAVCLSYLLQQPRCELLGITTVSGMARERAALADAVCRAAGRTDIPIVAGTEVGLTSGVIVQPACPQAEVLPRFPHRHPQEFEPNAAVEFLRRTIRKHPGEITLLAIGPMTNIGLLFATDPEIPALLQRVVVMCGMFNFCAPCPDPCVLEWNARCDPMATKILYRPRVAEHRSVGLDVTVKCIMPVVDCIDRFKAIGGPLAVVAAMTEVWKVHAHNVTFHDPLAAVCLFKPEICTWRAGQVSVVTGTGIVDGMTVMDWRGPQQSHLAAETVFPQLFLDEYFDVVGKK